MKLNWTKGITKERAVDVRSKFKEALLLRKRLIEMLESSIEDKRRSGSSEDMYDSPNWAYLQADRVGYERALREVIELISE